MATYSIKNKLHYREIYILYNISHNKKTGDNKDIHGPLHQGRCIQVD